MKIWSVIFWWLRVLNFQNSLSICASSLIAVYLLEFNFIIIYMFWILTLVCWTEKSFSFCKLSLHSNGCFSAGYDTILLINSSDFCTIRSFSRNFWHIPIFWMLFTQRFQCLKFYIKVFVAFWKDIFLHRAREVHLISICFMKLLSFPTTIYWTSPMYVFDTLEILRWLQMGVFISGTLLCHWFFKSVFMSASRCLWCHSSSTEISPASRILLRIALLFGDLVFPLEF